MQTIKDREKTQWTGRKNYKFDFSCIIIHQFDKKRHATAGV